MKILIVTNQKYIGGVNTIIIELAKALSKREHVVFILQGRSEKDFIRKGKIGKVNIYNYKIKQESYWRCYLMIILGIWQSISYLSKKIDFDLVYGPLSLSSLVAFYNPQSKNKLKIFNFQGAHGSELKSSILPPRRHKILGRIKRFLEFTPKMFFEDSVLKRCLKKADFVFTPSNWAKDFLIRNYQVDSKKIGVLPNPVNLKIFKSVSESEKRALKRRSGFSGQVKILLTASRLEPRKGLEKVVEAMPWVLKKIPQTFLLLVFPINSEYELYQLWRLYQLTTDLKLQNHVQFISGPQEKELADFYCLADCTLMPSVALETFGISMIESLACGTPVLGAPIGAIPEILKPIDKRLLFESSEPEDIARGITRFLSLSRKEKEEIKNKGFLYVKKNFSSIKIGNQFLHLVKRLLLEKP